ncbi:thioesterase II family protein [Burkholderia plantarii]|uniref:thioesterase II family protein n=1 Tax=Burkholderia plantarii TaxID=41899 RepID=UPI0018DD7582|nr:alpha/beta fold hydrolase [Burkholderia plantarii]MBI0328494.1 thioesterase [Burkholderia plantarii]
MSAAPHERWIRELQLSPGPRARIVGLPHAGGSAGFFRNWRGHLRWDLDLLAVQYPGREDRFGEPGATAIEALAYPVAEALRHDTDRPLVLFGHSLGAVLAYEVAVRLERAGRAPLRVFVSGHPAPHRQRRTDLHRQSDQALLADITRLSPDSRALFENTELRAVYLPMIRRDYQAIETYRCPRPTMLDTPLDIVLPLDDTEVDRHEALAWQQVTRGASRWAAFEGGHFYLKQQYPALIAWLTRQIDLTPSAPEELP